MVGRVCASRCEHQAFGLCARCRIGCAVRICLTPVVTSLRHSLPHPGGAGGVGAGAAGGPAPVATPAAAAALPPVAGGPEESSDEEPEAEGTEGHTLYLPPGVLEALSPFLQRFIAVLTAA